MEDSVFKTIKQGRIYGMSRHQIMTHMGIDPTEEVNRPQVWKVVAALANLRHRGVITSHIERGDLRYFPAAA